MKSGLYKRPNLAERLIQARCDISTHYNVDAVISDIDNALELCKVDYSGGNRNMRYQEQFFNDRHEMSIAGSLSELGVAYAMLEWIFYPDPIDWTSFLPAIHRTTQVTNEIDFSIYDTTHQVKSGISRLSGGAIQIYPSITSGNAEYIHLVPKHSSICFSGLKIHWDELIANELARYGTDSIIPSVVTLEQCDIELHHISILSLKKWAS
jgi:hypothetical protein